MPQAAWLVVAFHCFCKSERQNMLADASAWCSIHQAFAYFSVELYNSRTERNGEVARERERGER